MRELPQTDDGKQHPGPAPVVSGGGATRLGDLVGRETREVREGDEEQPGDDQPRHGNEDAAVEAEPERDHEERGEGGPRAKPMLPPTEKSDMPLARRLPLT